MKHVATGIVLCFGLALVACQTNTKSEEELNFPLGIHKWDKSQDNTTEPPSDNCTGCPEITINAPAGLDAAGWVYTLPGVNTSLSVSGTITNQGTSNCGPNNDLACSNEWRVWPPNSGDSAATAQTPGGELPDQPGSFAFDASFSCGTSRLVIVAENTFGLTRAIIDVTRGGSLCTRAANGKTLNVRLDWDTYGTDMDLHMVRPGGTYENSADDCYYATCKKDGTNEYGTSALDWGVAGDASDNPLLDVDDVANSGPENIFLLNPETGTYGVYVRYYSGTEVTIPSVEVYSDSVFVGMAFYGPTTSFTGNCVWHAGDVGVSGGTATFTEVNTVTCP